MICGNYVPIIRRVRIHRGTPKVGTLGKPNLFIIRLFLNITAETIVKYANAEQLGRRVAAVGVVVTITI